MMTVIKLLHLSDTHFCARPNRVNFLSGASELPALLTIKHLLNGKLSFFPTSYDSEIAENVARFVYERRKDLDLIVVSGDLATTGLPQDLEVAANYFRNPTEGYWCEMQPTIGFDNRRLLVMPGNHDRYESNSGHPGNILFDEIFARLWKARRPGVVRKVIEQGDVRLGLIAADFSLTGCADAEPKRFPYWLGQGKVHEAICQNLIEETQQTRNDYPGVFIIWVVHFPPVKICNEYLRLIDMQKLLDAANESNVKFILSGHLHEKFVELATNGVHLFCAGSACSFGPHDNFWLHELQISLSTAGQSEIRKIDYQWSDNIDDFLEKDNEVFVFEREDGLFSAVKTSAVAPGLLPP